LAKTERIFILSEVLERMRAGFFRQTMFAEFELLAHDARQRGEALSGQRFSEMYCGLLRKYHGADAGVMQIDPLYCKEWAYIPHFHRPFLRLRLRHQRHGGAVFRRAHRGRRAGCARCLPGRAARRRHHAAARTAAEGRARPDEPRALPAAGTSAWTPCSTRSRPCFVEAVNRFRRRGRSGCLRNCKALAGKRQAPVARIQDADRCDVLPPRLEK
jgi:hypothetical protein